MAGVGLSAFGPMFGAMLVSRMEGGGGIRALFRPLRDWRVNVGWYLVALLVPGATFAAGMAVNGLFGGTGPWFYVPENAARVTALVVFSFGEEIGWRGYALPRLQERYGPLQASAILGFFWCLWHIPMFMLAGLPLSLMPLLILFFIPGTVFFTWIYNRTRAGLPLAIVAHMGTHLNNSHRALPGNVTPLVVHTAGYIVLAAALVLFDRKAWRRPNEG
jgi:membrane protease YdiL (CAAX protease family)